ncbi:MAG: PD-(D/E)XK nuclease family protein, partial [Clostridia bacterium]|nr:PD-(D/E)XK nuclease family protein [Clostridia bacterium]
HAVAARAEGRIRDAEELSRLWDTLVDAIDALSAAIGDASVNTESYPQLLKLLFREINIARIPSSADAVLVGSADMLRVSGVKTVYLFGVNEGEFPAAVTDDSIFSDADKRVLASHDLPLKPDLDIRSSRELFAFLRAFTAASEAVSLVAFRFDAAMKPLRPSRVCEEIAGLLGDAVKRTDVDALSPDALLYGLEASSDRYAVLKDTPVGEPLREALLSDETAKRKVLVSEGKVTDPDCRVTERVMSQLYGESFTLTQTKLETYVKCPFQYFCRFVLRLDDDAPATFDFRNVGSFVHSALENLFRLLSDEGKTLRDISREELSSYADRVTEEAVRALAAEGDATTARIRHLMKSIRRRILVIMEDLYDEFSESEFVPRFFEMQLSAEDGPSPVTYTLPDGTTLVLRGTVDRVDAYKKDGKLYLRVVDYKTGTKRFSVDDIERGINLQLLVYLFSLWKNTRESFRKRLGVSEGEEVLPAGMLYMMASTADITLPAPLSPDEVREAAKRRLTRSGLLLNDAELLSAMDKELSGRYIPVTLTKKGEISKSSLQSLATLDEMGKLATRLDEIISEIGTEIKGGKADAAPQRDKKQNPCEYCEMKKICRKM